MGTPDDQGTATGQPAKRPQAGPEGGLWQGLRGRVNWGQTPTADPFDRRAPGAMVHTTSCLILGPVSSGKTALLYSLARCAEVHSHSYQGRYDVDITGGNEAFDNYRGKGVETIFRNGLVVSATQRNQFSAPEFRIEVHPSGSDHRPGRVTTFSSFDASGGLLEFRTDQPEAPATDATDPGSTMSDQGKQDDEQDQERLGIKAHKALLAQLAQAESVVFCIPLGRQMEHSEREFLARRIYELRERPRLHRLVVCFTMYEKLGQGQGRNAYRHLAHRGMARDLMAAALGGRDHGIAKALRSFQRTGRGVWCVPVSTYGFIPSNGGINFDPNNDSLLVRAPPARSTGTTPETPYSLDDAWELWRPFCTLDPFVFIATDDSAGTLIHRLEELEA